MITRRRTGRRPEGPIVEKPALNTIYICGRPISLRAIARTQNMDRSYVTKIMNGTRQGRISHFLKIASAIGVTVEELVMGIEQRVKEAKERKALTVKQYNDRVKAEDAADSKTRRTGRIVKPRLPGLRIPD